MNARLIAAMYEFQPAVDDAQPSVAWLTVMQEAYINLSIQDAKLCLENLPKFFCKAARYWTQGSEASVAATTSMRAILLEAVGPFVGLFSEDKSTQNPIKELFTPIENGLKYEFHDSWTQVLHLLATFFEVCGSAYHHLVGTCLGALADLRSSSNFSYVNELDYVVGKAIRTMGPQIVLNSIPLQITG